jgi:hypothetical protein
MQQTDSYWQLGLVIDEYRRSVNGQGLRLKTAYDCVGEALSRYFEVVLEAVAYPACAMGSWPGEIHVFSRSGTGLDNRVLAVMRLCRWPYAWCAGVQQDLESTGDLAAAENALWALHRRLIKELDKV